MERNALEKFQDQRNVILFANYFLGYFQEVDRIHYESPWPRFIDFNIFQAMTVCIYCNPVAIDLNQPTCDGALRRSSFFHHTNSYIYRHVLCSHIRPFTKMCYDYI